jgi:hypothetical protein
MKETEKKRGTWLTILLILMLIANLFTALTYFLLNKIVMSAYPNVSIIIWYIYGAIALANFICVIFLFMWKKWPFFALCVTTLGAFIMNLIIGTKVYLAIIGLMGIIILYFSMKSRWNLFK